MCVTDMPMTPNFLKLIRMFHMKQLFQPILLYCKSATRIWMVFNHMEEELLKLAQGLSPPPFMNECELFLAFLR